MSPYSADTSWEYYGKHDPYYGVLTQEKYRQVSLSKEARDEFFQSGAKYAHYIMEQVHAHIDPCFKPTNALDFGCGVGRVTIPLAGMCAQVTGVDVSPSMLAEAQRNCIEFSVTNTSFAPSDDSLSRVSGTFDLIHSYIVFQHIPCKRGVQIFRQLLDRLQAGGVGVLHFTFHRPAFSWSTVRYHLYQRIPILLGLRNLVKKRPYYEPLMDMNPYDLNQLFSILHEHGCRECHVILTDHGVLGAILLFRKAPSDTALSQSPLGTG